MDKDAKSLLETKTPFLLPTTWEISSKIIEVTPDLIKYKKCNKLDGPLFSINKSEVMMIRYSDGTKDIIKEDPISYKETKEFIDNSERKKGVNTFGIAAFACSFLGLFIAGLILGICGIVFGGIALSQKDKPKGLGIAGLVLGLIDVILILVYIS